MFGISTTEFLIILAVGLIVLGPQKLPELARALGKAIGEFRKATSEIKQTFEADENIAAVKKTFDDAVAEGMKSSFVQETVEDALSSGLAESMATSAAQEMQEDDGHEDKVENKTDGPTDGQTDNQTENQTQNQTNEEDWKRLSEEEEEFDFSEAADFTGEPIPAEPKPEASPESGAAESPEEKAETAGTEQAEQREPEAGKQAPETDRAEAEAEPEDKTT